ERQPLQRGEGSARRLLDDQREVARGGDRLGEEVSGLRERDHRNPPGAGDGRFLRGSARGRQRFRRVAEGKRAQGAVSLCNRAPTAVRSNVYQRSVNRKERRNLMSTNDTFLAVFLGSKTNTKMAAWNALPEAERRAREQQGIAAWKAWVEKHQAAIVAMGGPLGKTKKVDSNGIADIANEMGAFTVVRAGSHEAAAKLFDNHPHFAIFPGERVEIMPVLPIPGG